MPPTSLFHANSCFIAYRLRTVVIGKNLQERIGRERGQGGTPRVVSLTPRPDALRKRRDDDGPKTVGLHTLPPRLPDWFPSLRGVTSDVRSFSMWVALPCDKHPI